jgi:hypothetical protein
MLRFIFDTYHRRLKAQGASAPGADFDSSSGWQRIAPALLLALFALPFVVHVWNVLAYVVDIPIEDDFGIFLGPVMGFVQTASLADRWQLIVSQSNMHRFVFSRLVGLADYYLTGRLNFAHIIVFANIGWLLAVLLFIRAVAREARMTLLQLLPMPYLLLVPTQHVNMFMAANALQFYWSILFSLALFVSLFGRRIWLSCILHALALSTTGAGLPLGVLGVAVLLLHKRRTDALIYFASSSVFTVLYFVNYHSYTTGLTVLDALANLGGTLSFFFVFLGNVLPVVDLARVLGILVAAGLALVIAMDRERRLLFVVAVWLLITAGVVTLNRSFWGLGMAISSRYVPYAVLAVAALYAWAHTERARDVLRLRFPTRTATVAALVVAVGLFFGAHLHYRTTSFFRKMKTERIQGMTALAVTGTDVSRLTLPDEFKEPVKYALLLCYELGVYDYKNALSFRLLPRVRDLAPIANSDFEGYLEQYDGFFISGWAHVQGTASPDSTISILLTDSSRIYVIPAIPAPRPDVSAHLGLDSLYDHAGYEGYLAAYAVPTGPYQIGILVEQGDTKAVHWSEENYVAP